MGGNVSLSGPDFEQGIATSDVPDGGMLLGHAGGEAVLLTRRGNDVSAIGATCTHYSGPLGEGLLVGDTVRCPWHHACFDVRTGEALGAPALNPVPCWKVERTGDRLVVREKLVRERVKQPSTKHPASVVIVGGGAAGEAAAEMLRRHGYAGEITMLSADDASPVDRPNLSKDYLAGNAPEEWIPLRPQEFFEEQRISLRLGTRVTAIDAKSRRVTLSDGSSVAYGALLLATGAEPFVLPIPGADRANVFVLRTLAQSRAIIAAANKAKRAVVIGSSFIGLEVAASLRARGIEVDVVGKETRPLERVLGPAMGDMVRALHESKGVRFHLGDSPVRIGDDGVQLERGGVLPADLVVMGVGVRPNLQLAEAAGLRVDRGVMVDATLATSAPGVWAAGDIARYLDRRSGDAIRVEHWVVAQRQGQCAARNMLGAKETYHDVPFFWSQHYDVAISYVGHAESWDRIDVDGDIAAKDAAVAYRRSGKTLAVATIGRDHVALEAEAAMERDDEAALQKLIPASGK
jgi:NADPH-dependent 2,4-dienoyl-CoA reductase/sulfur reductase-like enzyme/nitrite reductase/ring-hydroxylating ferredoxin subunit